MGEQITLTLSRAEADCLVMMMAYFEEHENYGHRQLSAEFAKRLMKAGAR